MTSQSGRKAVRMSDDEVAAFLAGNIKVQVATAGRDGVPHLTTLFYVLHEGRIAFWTYGSSQKIRNLERDPRLSCLVEDGVDYFELRGVSITGKAELVRLVALDDAGTILNPLIAEGQRHGGLAQGAAQALCEEMLYDADGNPTTSTFADYTVISAAELPSFELVSMETPTPVNPLGAKGIGESGTIGSTPAVQSAVVDALSHLGIRHVDMPATPQRVWAAIQSASSKN